MLSFIHRILMTLGATLGMVGIYAIKAHWIIHPHVPFWVAGLGIFLLSGCISFLCLSVGKSLSHDEIKNCADIRLIDQEMTRPYYLYMILAVVSPDFVSFGFVYFLVFVLHYKLQSQFSNPWFLFAGFHFYRVKTTVGTEIFLLAQGKVIRHPDGVRIPTLRRYNDSTYIGYRRKRGADAGLDEAE